MGSSLPTYCTTMGHGAKRISLRQPSSLRPSNWYGEVHSGDELLVMDRFQGTIIFSSFGVRVFVSLRLGLIHHVCRYVYNSFIHHRIDLVLFYTDVRRRSHANTTLQLPPSLFIRPSLPLSILGFPRAHPPLCSCSNPYLIFARNSTLH